MESYKAKKPIDSVTHPMTSVQTRIKKILKETVRYSACYKSINNTRRSDHIEDDDKGLATALFNKIKVTHPYEEVGRPFRFLPCWELFRDLPKFIAMEHGNASSGGETETSELCTNREMNTNMKKEQKIRLDGRLKCNDNIASQHMRAKKIKVAER